MTTLRFFAAAREAAGTRTTDVDARTVGEALKIACEQFGPRFEEVLAHCTLVVGDEQYTLDTASGLEADEVAVLPPVSGGSADQAPPQKGARMADVGAKEESKREAVASCRLVATPDVRDRIMRGDLPKGEALEAARIAGILAAKRVPELIPLCHPVRMNHIGITFEANGQDTIAITASIRGVDRTGFEIEALTAASIAALTLYDMAKSEDPRMTIGELRLESKSGGKSGEWTR
jgi:cyclic pyranopterin phosphate synthase